MKDKSETASSGKDAALPVGRGKPEQKAFREQVWRKQRYKAKQQKSRGKKNRKAAKTGWIKANLTNEWEAQRHGEINSGSQQTPRVKRGEKERKGREGKEKASQPESFASQPEEGGLPGQSSQLTSYKGGPESQLVESSQTGQAIQERNPRSEQSGSSPSSTRQRGDLQQAPRSAGGKGISSAHLHTPRSKKMAKNVTAMWWASHWHSRPQYPSQLCTLKY